MRLSTLLNKVILFGTVTVAATFCAAADSIPTPLQGPLPWRVGVDVAPAWVPATNAFLRGNNPVALPIDHAGTASLHADFNFNPSSRLGRLYKGLYQGLGVSYTSFNLGETPLGNPVSVYVYQGMPFLGAGRAFSLGYEWQFGTAVGWKHLGDGHSDNMAPVSTAVTAHMALGLKARYQLSSKWEAVASVMATHFSNGNTSYPNAGVNMLSVSLGMAYLFNHPERQSSPSAEMAMEADRQDWMWDVTLFGALRKRIVTLPEGDKVLCPGRFAVAGLQVSPLWSINRYVAVGPSLDLQWDESANLADNWVEGTSQESIKFYRPDFGSQVSAGLSAHAELTMPVFAVNAGIGVEIFSPRGDKRFYQMLTLKTFVTRNLYLNTGYRLGDFRDPQNLMLGLGWRFR